MTKLPTLTPDDPLRSSTSAPPPPAASSAEAAAPVTDHASNEAPPAEDAPDHRRQARRRPAPAPAPAQLSERPMPPEEWSGATDVTTFRLPAELLRQLHQRSRDLGLAKGMTVAAALLDVFQRGDDELVQLVEQTQQRYDTARRRARRAA